VKEHIYLQGSLETYLLHYAIRNLRYFYCVRTK